jgi:hypothetical protein
MSETTLETPVMSNGSTATIQIRVPKAAAKKSEAAPAFTLGRPMAGLRIGLRHEGSWRSWMLIVDEWTEFLKRDGAIPISVKAGSRVGDEGEQTRADVDRWAAEIDAGISGLGTCGSCTSNSVRDAVTLEDTSKPAIVAVCSEFEDHARNMARYLGHDNLKMLVLPYPLEARPAEELKAIARDNYPAFLTMLGVTA